ncbi:MAG: hypothetical protein EKK42_24490 [Pseudonocardiaceae bacterium]|nr:MAG: hypothetical protein EKK42_24490 [Pseudonocardiaceae bacterium]
MSYATTDDVAARLGRQLDPAELTIVSARLDDVERLIRTRVPDLDVRVSSGALSAAVVVMVEADAVLRVVRNPDGVVSETDGNYSRQLNHAAATGVLSLLPEEWRLLKVRGAFVVLRSELPIPVAPEEGAFDPYRGPPPWAEDFPSGIPGGPHPDGQAVWWSNH